MKTETGAGVEDTKRIELRSGLAEPGEEHPDSKFIVPAGILIGLGVGLLADLLVVGFLVGLGIGLIGSELLMLARRSREGECMQAGCANITTLLFGVFLVFIGICLVLVPAAVWPYAIAGCLILAGIGLLVRGFYTIP